MEGKKDYKCEVSNKFYKNYKSLWKHKYKYNKSINNISINTIKQGDAEHDVSLHLLLEV